MPELLHHAIAQSALSVPDAPALFFRQECVSYSQLHNRVTDAATGLLKLGIAAGERVAIYLPKQPENIYGMFGAASAGACFVPINPLLKPRQVAYILANCNVRVLITSVQRLKLLEPALQHCPDLQTVVVTEDSVPKVTTALGYSTVTWHSFIRHAPIHPHERTDTDLAAILYTSGSSGQPKGVMLSHRNMVMGANSVARYISKTASDRILAVLPLSFDAGLSQLTTAFSVGAAVVLMDYLLPRDVIRAVTRYQVTGLAAVPPLWNQLIGLEWPPEAVKSLRYITNTGGAMPVATTRALQEALPDTEIYLMYGLTEAFRSTYLPPDQLGSRPESIGKAIPNAEILVINQAGEECAANEPGELVHCGPLVAMGYWNDRQRTAERFKPRPGHPAGQVSSEIAVWSGDQVVRDAEDYLYFISRMDDMIKTSGYRVSPGEVEEVALESGLVTGAAALGIAHPKLGQAILLVVTTGATASDNANVKDLLMAHCRGELPNYMMPLRLVERQSMPLNPNGKIDRKKMSLEYQQLFMDEVS